MKVVQAVGWYHPDSLGGTEVYVAGLCRRLRAAGQDVLVAAPDSAHGVERTYEYDSVPVYRYPIPPRPTRPEAQGMVPVRGAERFHGWLARQRPQAVHFHTFGTGLGLAELRAAKATGARVIATAHSGALGFICQRGTMMRWGEHLCDGVCVPAKCAACALQQRGLPKLLARVLARLPPALGRFARPVRGKLGTALSMSDLIARNQASQDEMLTLVDKFVLLTRWALDAALANGASADRLALNRLGLSEAKPAAKPGPEEQPTVVPITVGYLGRFDPIKGVHDLARAVVSLPRDAPIRAEFRGPVNDRGAGSVLEELRRLVARDPRVTFGPSVLPAETAGILAGYDALCCPSVCLEGGPTVAIESHAIGTPVIGTRIGGLAELVTDRVNGRLVPPRDWKALARVLGEMAGDPARTVDRWRRALPPVRTMDQIAAEYVTLYAP